MVARRQYSLSRGQLARQAGDRIKMTDFDFQADPGLGYHDHELHVVIPLTAPVSEMWCQRYEALAWAKDIQATARGRPDGPAMLALTVPVKTSGAEARAMLDTARALIAEADAVDQQPASSDSPEAAVRQWWAHQRA
jgi:hypothetical protein